MNIDENGATSRKNYVYQQEQIEKNINNPFWQVNNFKIDYILGGKNTEEYVET